MKNGERKYTKWCKKEEECDNKQVMVKGWNFNGRLTWNLENRIGPRKTFQRQEWQVSLYRIILTRISMIVFITHATNQDDPQNFHCNFTSLHPIK